MSTGIGRQAALKNKTHELSAFVPLGREVERRLARAFASGDHAAGECIVRAHLRYVVDVARQFRGRGVAFEDLVQEGNIGLLRALSRYDAERQSARSRSGSVRFIAYATPWVKAEMRRAIEDQGTPVRIGRHLHLAVSKMRKLDKLVYAVSGRYANDAEVAAHLRIKEKKVGSLRVVQAIRFSSFDKPMLAADDAVRTLHDRFADDVPAIDDALSESDFTKKRRGALAEAAYGLSEREMKILHERLLRDPGDRKTHLQLGREMGLCRTRVQQLELRLIRTLRTLVQKTMARKERRERC